MASKSRKDLLRAQSHGFCHALIDAKPDIEKIITNYFTPSNARITEHGPEWARDRLPFLVKTFSGKDGILDYFKELTRSLNMQMDEKTFPAPEGFVVDEDAVVEGEDGKGIVSVVGKAGFESVKTGKGWKEEFIYRLSGFDEEGRIGHWVCLPLSPVDGLTYH